MAGFRGRDCRRGHHIGLVQSDGHDRFEFGVCCETGEVPGARVGVIAARLLGRDIPERTVDGIACGASRQRLQQVVPVETLRDRRRDGADCFGDRFGTLAVARVRKALASANKVIVGNLGDDNGDFSPRTA